MSESRADEISKMLGNPPENEAEEDVEEESPEDKDEQEEEGEEDTEEEEGAEGEEEEEGEENKDEKEKKESKDKTKIKNADRWHGKSREDVIRAFEELEGTKGSDGKVNKEDAQKKADELGIDMPSDDDLAKMTPKKFVEWVIEQVKKQVSSTYDEKSAVRQSVSDEIRQAQKDHPLLKKSAEYRELVLALIDSAAKKGETLSLTDACAKVDVISGTDKGDESASEKEKTRMKKEKARVERGGGGTSKPTGEERGADKDRLEKVFGRIGAQSPLGGLGV